MMDLDKVIKIEVTSPSGELLTTADNEHISFPRANEDPAGGGLLIIKGRELGSFSFNHGVYVIAYMKNGDRIRYVGSVRISLPHQINIQIQSGYGVVMPERRRYFKVDADLMCSINAYERMGMGYEYEIPLAATIKNISIGGIFLMCTDQKFSPEDTLDVNFKVNGETVSVTAKVLRAQTDDTGRLVGYGCQFLNADSEQEEQFAKLVYNIQLQKRNEEMERRERRLDAKR